MVLRFSISFGFENSLPLSVRITGNKLLNVFAPRTSSNKFMISITEADVFASRKKASMRHTISKKGVLYMSQSVNVNFKLDADVKKSMEQVCSELGLSMSAAFTVFAKKVGREKRIPFEVSVDPFYSDSNIRYLENIVRDIKDGKAHFAEHDLIEED